MSQNNEQREREIARRARQLFAQNVAGLDGPTRSRLAQARTAAVESVSRRRLPPLGRPASIAFAGAAATALVAAAIVWQMPEQAAAPAVDLAVLDEWELLLEGENFELLEELEFYAWLLEQPEVQAFIDEDGSG
jgi:hypothetical protein